jgi:hypothetical protein
MRAIKLTCVFAYIFAGTGLFIYLFSKFLRRGVTDTDATKESLFVQNYRINMRILSHPRYSAWFVVIMIGLFAFMGSIAFMVDQLRILDLLFSEE